MTKFNHDYLNDEGYRVIPRSLEAESGEVKEVVAPRFTQRSVGKGRGQTLPKDKGNKIR